MEGLKQHNSRINAVQALLALVNAILLIGGVMLALRARWGPRAPVMLLPALAAVSSGVRTIVLTVAISAAAACFFPHKEAAEQKEAAHAA